jgi:hypothetical protein
MGNPSVREVEDGESIRSSLNLYVPQARRLPAGRSAARTCHCTEAGCGFASLPSALAGHLTAI